MIVRNGRECALECTVCGELMGVTRRQMENEASLVVLTAQMAAEHARCAELKDDPRRAQLERHWAARMAAELKGTG